MYTLYYSLEHHLSEERHFLCHPYVSRALTGAVVTHYDCKFHMIFLSRCLLHPAAPNSARAPRAGASEASASRAVTLLARSLARLTSGPPLVLAKNLQDKAPKQNGCGCSAHSMCPCAFRSLINVPSTLITDASVAEVEIDLAVATPVTV